MWHGTIIMLIYSLNVDGYLIISNNLFENFIIIINFNFAHII